MSYKIIPRPDTMRSEEVKHEKLRSPFNKFKTSQNCGHLLLSNRGKSKWKCNFYLREVFLLHPDLPVVTVEAHFCHRLLQNLEHFICKFKVPRFTISITFVPRSEYIITAAPLPLQKCCCKLHQVISCPIERGRLVSTVHFQPNFQLTFTGQNQP